MTIKLPDETDVLISEVKSNANVEAIASALCARTSMPIERVREIGVMVLRKQKVSIACENRLEAEELCSSLRRAGCAAVVENEETNMPLQPIAGKPGSG